MDLTNMYRISSGERDHRLQSAADMARNAGVTVTLRDDNQTVIVNYDYSTRRAAERLGDEMAGLGFRCTWNSSTIDGDDQVWTLTDTEK